MKDSICSIVTDNCVNPSIDTIINNVRYAYALQLKNNCLLVSREYNEQYNCFVDAQILYKDDTLHCKLVDDDDHFFEVIALSPNKEYIAFVETYETGTTEPEGIVVVNLFLKFHSVNIYDVVNKRIVYTDYMGEAFGNWTYCNQWVVDGRVFFEPNK